MKKILIFLTLFTLILAACTNSPAVLDPESDPGSDHVVQPEPEDQGQPEQDITEGIGIYQYPLPLDLTEIFGKLGKFPDFNPNDPQGIQLISNDLRDLDLSNQLEALLFASFDDCTQWPDALPSGFDYQRIMELGKNPGLSIRKLHEAGITGQGIGLAVIDQPLFVEHSEFGDRIKHYEQINFDDANTASFHGGAVSSIAVGESVGVAPGADLYHIAVNFGEYVNNNFVADYNWIATAIDRLIELNHQLPGQEKIRVIAIARGWVNWETGYTEVLAAIERAKENNIFVISSSLSDSYGFMFHGLGRSVYDDPDEVEAFTPGLWWASDYWRNDLDQFKSKHGVSEVLLIPMDSRTCASPSDKNQYSFLREGGWSFSIPWIAGLYALACQVDTDITPDKFWELALETGDTVEVEKAGTTHALGKIVNPGKLLGKLQ